MTDNPNPLPNPRRSPDSEPPLPVWMTLPGSLAQPSAPSLEVESEQEDTTGPADADEAAGEASEEAADAALEGASALDEPPSGDAPTGHRPAAAGPEGGGAAESGASRAAEDSGDAGAGSGGWDAEPIADDRDVRGGMADEPERLKAEPSAGASVPEASAGTGRGMAADAAVAGPTAGTPAPGSAARPSGAGSAGGGALEPGARRAAGEPGDAAGEARAWQAGPIAGEGDDDEGDPEQGDRGPTLEAALEAILLVVDEPVAEVTLAQVLERPTHEVAAALRGLAAEYTAAGRGFDLREVAGGWRFYTRADCAPLVERFVRDGQQTRLTQAALETLAVVAYRQPVSRARVAAVRGVNSDGVMRTLVARGLVEEAGTDPESQAVLYRTTSYFLERLGLRDLSELPELAPFLPDDVENLEETTK